MSCVICPRKCQSSAPYCGKKSTIKVALAALHFGEEPPLVGEGGSGTVFLSGCNMQCPFCQNWQISRGEIGQELTEREFIDILFQLKTQGACNINFVTGTHYSTFIIKALKRAKDMGLDLPILWNSSAYESLTTLHELAEVVDIWLPDLKTLDSSLSERLYGLSDYPKKAMKSLHYMISQGYPRFTEEGIMETGTIIRHLILPNELKSTEGVLQWFSQFAKGKALLSLLSQYTPVDIPEETRPIPRRYVDEGEYDQVVQWLEEYSIEEGYIQELETGSEWLPDFRTERPFSSSLAKVIWKTT